MLTLNSGNAKRSRAVSEDRNEKNSFFCYAVQKHLYNQIKFNSQVMIKSEATKYFTNKHS